MYRKNHMHSTSMRVNQSTEGRTLEQKLEQITQNKEKITDGSPLIYTERSAGIMPAYDIRTDRFEIAVEAMDKVSKSYKARREEKAEMKIVTDDEKGGETTSAQGTK